MDAAVEAEDQADRELGHGVGRVGRHPDDRDVELGGGGEVDIVEAGAAQRHQPRAAGRERGQGRPVELVVDEDADGREARGEGGGLGRQARLQVVQLVPAAGSDAVEEAAVVGLGAEDGDPHRGRSLPWLSSTAATPGWPAPAFISGTVPTCRDQSRVDRTGPPGGAGLGPDRARATRRPLSRPARPGGRTIRYRTVGRSPRRRAPAERSRGTVARRTRRSGPPRSVGGRASGAAGRPRPRRTLP